MKDNWGHLVPPNRRAEALEVRERGYRRSGDPPLGWEELKRWREP